MTPMKLGLPTAALVVAALLGAACGSGPEWSNRSHAGGGNLDGAVDGPGSDDDGDRPGSLAAIDDGNGGEETSDSPASLVAMDRIEELLAEFTTCLNDEGAGVAVLTIADLTARLPSLPADAQGPELFGHFFQRDVTDPVVAAAMDTCEPILDDPAIAMFLPTE